MMKKNALSLWRHLEI